jgi:5-methylcytosine-specific restriction endonuclease McrA
LPDGADVPAFYERQNDGGLILTDAAFSVFDRAESFILGDELDARWDLLEAAFELKREPGTLANDIRRIYLEKGYERSSVTHLMPVLYGYQEGRCFYCGEMIPPGDGHVDHLIPRQFLQHDEPWNLVLAHGFCNLNKSDHLPGAHFVEQLINRNEALIASNHPLRQHVIAQLGASPVQRRRTVDQTYRDARVVIPWEWSGLPGYEPATSEFYRMLVRGMTK